MQTAVSQRNPGQEPECIIALTCEPRGTSSFITLWVSEPVDSAPSPKTAAARGRPPVTLCGLVNSRARRIPVFAWEARGCKEEPLGRATQRVCLSPRHIMVACLLYSWPAPTCTHLSSTPRGSGYNSPNRPGAPFWAFIAATCSLLL